MTAYATPTQLETFGLPADVVARAGTKGIDVAAHLAAASAEADGYLRARYDLPLSTWGLDLTRSVCALAAESVLAVLGYNPEGPEALVPRRARDARRWLEGVRAGTTDPGIALVDTTPDDDAPPWAVAVAELAPR